MHALAVPLRDMQGCTVAALNGVTSPLRMTADSLRQYLLPAFAGRGARIAPAALTTTMAGFVPKKFSAAADIICY